MNDILGKHIGRGCLGPEDIGHRPDRFFSSFDFQIFVDNIKGIHLLPFIFVKALNLNVKDCIRIQPDSLSRLHVGSQLLLAVHLDLSQPIKHLLTVLISEQLSQFIRILLKPVADGLGQKSCQLPVTAKKPSSEGNAIGLIVKLFGINLIKCIQFGVFQDFRVNRRHPVYGKSVVNIDVSHMHQAIPVDNPHLGIRIFLCRAPIQFFYIRNKLGHHLFQIVKRPLFQSLR